MSLKTPAQNVNKVPKGCSKSGKESLASSFKYQKDLVDKQKTIFDLKKLLKSREGELLSLKEQLQSTQELIL
jgi:hypothetical protein